MTPIAALLCRNCHRLPQQDDDSNVWVDDADHDAVCRFRQVVGSNISLVLGSVALGTRHCDTRALRHRKHEALHHLVQLCIRRVCLRPDAGAAVNGKASLTSWPEFSLVFGLLDAGFNNILSSCDGDGFIDVDQHHALVAALAPHQFQLHYMPVLITLAALWERSYESKGSHSRKFMMVWWVLPPLTLALLYVAMAEVGAFDTRGTAYGSARTTYPALVAGPASVLLPWVCIGAAFAAR